VIFGEDGAQTGFTVTLHELGAFGIMRAEMLRLRLSRMSLASTPTMALSIVGGALGPLRSAHRSSAHLQYRPQADSCAVISAGARDSFMSALTERIVRDG
jgi:hypothetical protein